MNHQPLDGIRVIELGSFIAGPFATRILAEFGAEVVKVEPPGGDQIRKWGLAAEGEEDSYFSKVILRNKKSVVVDLHYEEGREIVRELLRQADVVVENFKPGTLEKWNLSHREMRELNPGLIITSVTGYGQTGPYRHRPGFGNIAESFGGLRYVTGYPDRPPVRVGLSLADSISGLYAVIGTLLALFHRDRNQDATGQVVDVALYESVFSLLESILPEYVHLGAVRERTGNQLATTAPSNIYPTKDGKWVAIGANSDSLFKRLMTLMGREDLAQKPELSDNRGRVAAAGRIDALIGEWTLRHTCDEVVAMLEQAAVPAGPVYGIADIFRDPHYREREMFLPVPDASGAEIMMPGIVPKMSGTPGSVLQAGPVSGAHTKEVLSACGFTEEQINEWRNKGVIHCG
ncbi:CaiB/BaiF CoA transferase family protein [Thermoactinomyces sp. CICC 10521]|uniref:CaiB/BaiF CoA transferase family protein n=1 Tax=unclassified Thermoactinomyces TaxID=2634588 RepID=UPI00351C9AA8